LLPLIPIGIALASAIGGAAVGSAHKKNNASASPAIIPSKTMANKQEMIFIASLLGTAAKADGLISDMESAEINKELDSFFTDYHIETDIMGIMKDRVINPISIKQLRESYQSLDSVSEEQKDRYRNIVHAVIASDAAITLPEQVLQYKIELMLADLPNMPIYSFDQTVQSNNSDVLYIIDPLDIKRLFPLTKQRSFAQDMVFTLHPATNEELVPISLFFDENFAQDKDTELVRIAQMAGAKKVTIISYSKDSEDISGKLNISANASYKVASGGLDVKTAAENIAEMESKTSLQFLFEGKRGLLDVSNVFGLNKREILSHTKWLKSDPKLSSFVESCFGTNRVKSFDWDGEYTEVGNSMLSAAVAAKCKLPGLNANLKTSYESKAKKYTQRKNRYHIEF
jgi:hypothetical protein